MTSSTTRTTTSATERAARAPGPAPALAVAREFARALVDLALLLPRAASYFVRRRAIHADVRADLQAPAVLDALEPFAERTDGRPLRIFLSSAEASGEVHARKLGAELQALCAERGLPAPELLGLGGARLEELGVELVGRPVDRAAMGFDGILRALPYYLGLLRDCARVLRERRPDLFLPVDSPALHVPLAHIARAYGVRTVHYVTPQYWGWAPWRVGSYRRCVDLALAILPFEPAWFARHRVRCKYVGHPQLDVQPPASTEAAAPSASGRRLVLLPGSRAGVVRRNLPWMLETARLLRERLPDVELVIAHDMPELLPDLEREVAAAGLPVEVRTEDLHAELARATAALSVSGTILTDLLHHRLPAVVLYRLKRRREVWMKEHFLSTPWFSSVNLLAAREVYPEFAFRGEGPRDAVVAALEQALTDPTWRAECRAGLDLAADRLGPPGASRRAAWHALREACGADVSEPSEPLSEPRGAAFGAR